jgi:gliding motility-associated-like protein
MRLKYLFLLLFALPLALTATHNRAGEIIVRASGDCANINNQLTACATIITYTETFDTEVDRDTLTIFWGDGTIQNIGRTLIEDLGEGIQKNEYTMCHRYSGFGRYFISFEDMNRVALVENIDNGGSVNIPFSVSTSYFLTNPLLNGCNSSPEMTQVPIEAACIGSVWTHNPGAFDVDGDSLAFEFTVPERAPRVPIANYVLPNLTGGSASLFINESTGQITWDTPLQPGEYTLAFLIKSFRNGIPLDTVIRDMQIFVEECNNLPPSLELPMEEICVVAGEVVEFRVIAGAPFEDATQMVRLEANGRPFDLEENAATFLPDDPAFQDDPLIKTFRWETSCGQISNQPYFVVFRAEDNFFELNNSNREGGLATLRSVSIKVVAPPPTGLQTVADDNEIVLTWDKPQDCEEEDDPIFLGFTVWRREGSNPFAPDTCETGLAGRGYDLLTPIETTEMLDDRYVYIDDDIERGKTYCYRVVALFGRPIANLGLIFEEIESIPSEEVCVQLARDIPLITMVDVLRTGSADGEIDVCWVLPSAEALDTVLNSGPYRYVLSRAIGQTEAPGDFTEITSFTTQFFNTAVETCFNDNGLDTEGLAYSYRIELFVENETEPIEVGQPASSVRLGGAPTDEAVELNWSALVPWTNISYEVFRRLPGAASYDFLTTVTEATYRDNGLNNGEEYCYFIRASGTYSVPEIPSPLLNRSQEICLVPVDNVPPCPPTLEVTSVCDRGVDCTIRDNLFNTLDWMPGTGGCSDDVVGYRLYFSVSEGSDRTLVSEISAVEELTFDHMPNTGVTGCYTVTAFDGLNNESDFSNEVCVSNCPIYELPNAFTPNGDGQNELFVPRGRCFVERVDFKIYNRWGQIVFETEDPAINWDGKNLNGDPLPSGTYHYVGQVFERRLEGVVEAPAPVSGYIELITGN